MFFLPQSDPRIFALPVGCDFSRAFIDGLTTRLKGAPPEAWAGVMILVNTRRAQRRLEALLMEAGPRLLPDIKVISDIGAAPGAPTSQSRFLRHLALSDLVAAFLEAEPDMAPKTAMFGLAESLADLQDEMAGEGVDFEALHGINTEGLSAHWTRCLTFLDILERYQATLPEKMLAGAEAQQRAAVESLAAHWEQTPPDGPVILAGSTGSRATTALLMQAVAALPQGAVVLPGYDYTTPRDLWPQMGEEHPQFGFAELSATLGFDPANVPLWHNVTGQNTARNALVSLALRPAPVTPHWLDEAPLLAESLPDATAQMTLLSAPDARMEATALAVCLREALERGQKAALVTPDRNLTRRVTAQLDRWGILPDDSAGHPGKLTPPGVFLRMVAQGLGQPLAPVNLMEILKHPLCASDDKDTRKTHLRLARSFEAKALRGGAVGLDLTGFLRWKEKTEGGADWLARIAQTLLLLESVNPRPLADWAALHKETAEGLSGAGLWEKEAGREVAKVFDTLALGADHETPYSAGQYRALFISILERIEVRDDPLQAHPDIAIWGTLEARVQSVDLVIVAGLNEGTWPKLSGHDPWMNRDMRRQVGLTLPERRIGLSAHDFQQALGAKEVVISRSLRDGEAPSVASRWVLRLQNLIGGMQGGSKALADMTARGALLLALAASLDRPASPPQPEKRPCPAPPLAARPRRLSVTKVEDLIRDPYTVYARYVLGLRPLDPLIPVADARMRGNVLHAALERFVVASKTGLPKNPEHLYNQCIDAALQANVPWPATRALWRHHFIRARNFFLESEAARRRIGAPYATEITGARVVHGEAFDLTLTAKADRIDITPSGGAIIYDYKAGNPEAKAKIKAFKVQLPLEGAIAEAQGFEGLNADHVAGLSLLYFGSKAGELEFEPEDPVMVDVWRRVAGFLSLYQRAETGYGARLRPELIFFEGDYDHLSRRGEWPDDAPLVAEIVQ